MLKKVPHTYTIVFSIIIICAILTWIIPGGEYARETVDVNGVERTVIVNDSFHEVAKSPQTWQVFSALFNGFEKQAGIIAFILIIGGAFWIMNNSKAIDVGIFSFLRSTQKLEHIGIIRKLGVNNIIITMVMLLFSCFGAIFGMSEETLAFVIIIVPLAISMGYDSLTGVCMVYVAAHVGFAGAILNPFTIGIAQGLSDLPLFSGFEYRVFCWAILNVIMIAWVLRYAAKVKKNPKASLVYNLDSHWRQEKVDNTQEIEYKSSGINRAICLDRRFFFTEIFPLFHLDDPRVHDSFPNRGSDGLRVVPARNIRIIPCHGNPFRIRSKRKRR